MRLNLGSCDRKFPGFLSVDLFPPADIICDLNGPWPWEDSSVDEVKALSVFEHIGDCDHVTTVSFGETKGKSWWVSGWCCYACLRYRSDEFSPGADQKYVRHPRAKIHVMNELWRVLKPGARATIVLPLATEGDGGHCDPTHRSYWTTSDFEYFTAGDPHRERFDKYYGVKARFNVVNLVVGKIPIQRYKRRYGGTVAEMTVILEAVK